MDQLLFEYLTLVDIKKDNKQIQYILRNLSSSQTYKLKRFIRNVLNGQTPLSDATYRELSKYKVFLRQINRRFNVNIILKNYIAFSKVLKIMLNKKYGAYEESSSNTLRRMEGDDYKKRNKIVNNRHLSTRRKSNEQGEEEEERCNNEETEFAEENRSKTNGEEEEEEEEDSFSENDETSSSMEEEEY